MSLLLTGTVSEIKAWGRRQHSQSLSCRYVYEGRSPGAAQTFAQVGLHIVHSALNELDRYVTDRAKQYLVLYLHEAIITAIFSRWTDFEDDARSLVALEIAHRARNALAHGLIEVARETTNYDYLLEKALENLSPPPEKAHWKRPEIRPELVNYIYVRILQDLFQESNQDVYLSKLERLRAGFGLNQHELARLLDVTAESIRKWVRGGGISADVRGVIDLNVALLDQLETYVRPGLLPAILRRPARGLDGRRPIDLLFSKDGESIAQYLENLTSYATTA